MALIPLVLLVGLAAVVALTALALARRAAIAAPGRRPASTVARVRRLEPASAEGAIRAVNRRAA